MSCTWKDLEGPTVPYAHTQRCLCAIPVGRHPTVPTTGKRAHAAPVRTGRYSLHARRQSNANSLGNAMSTVTNRTWKWGLGPAVLVAVAPHSRSAALLWLWLWLGGAVPAAEIPPTGPRWA